MRTDCFDGDFFASLTLFLGRECANRVSASVLIIKDIPRVLKSLKVMEKAFRKSILSAKKSIKNATRETPDSLPRISGGDAKTINDAVMEIRHLTSQADDLVNELDVDGAAIPSVLMDYISKYDDLLPTPTKDGSCVFRLDVLNRIAEIRANEKLAPEYSFVVRHRSAILKLHKELEALESGVNEFNEWIHDMGHYLVQLDRKLPCVTDVGVQMLEDDLRVIDALFSGISLLEVGVQMSLAGDDVLTMEGESAGPYEPYKVFHKLRYIYSERGIVWKNGEKEFWGKVTSARGIEFAAMNLYTNAVKYLERYPGAKEIATIFTQNKDGLEISIESYGPMPTVDEESRISHHAPCRAESAASYKGTGRGLHRVRRICEEAGYSFDIKVDRDRIKYEIYAPFIATIFIPKKYQID